MRGWSAFRWVIIAMLFVGVPGPGAQAQLLIQSGKAANILAQKLVGQGLSISNATLTGDINADGIFTGAGSSLGLDSGILLTTGYSSSVAGPSYNLASANLGTAGDVQLNSLAHANTHDAFILEFDLIPKDDSIRFEYVFGSEEYINATCGPYNDAFGFFISGPGITGSDNMALVPGTNIPVTVNSINSGIPGSQGNISNCTSLGPGSPFTQYFINNQNGSSLSYQGFTTVLKAVHAVTPCSTYHLKIMIADAGNALYDSGVFLKAGSLRSTTYNIRSSSGSGANPPIVVAGCAGAVVTVKRDVIKSSGQLLHYIISGTAGNGSDYSRITDSVYILANDSTVSFSITGINANPGGPKTLMLFLLDPLSCNGLPQIVDSTRILFYDAPSVKILTPDTGICMGTSILIRTQGTYGLNYTWYPKTGWSDPHSPDPVVTPVFPQTYVLSAILPGSGCPSVSDSVRLSILLAPKANAGPSQHLCSGSRLELQAVVDSTVPNASYTWNGPNGYSASGPMAFIDPVNVANAGVYTLRVHGTQNPCYGNDTVNIKVAAIPPAPAVVSPLQICLHLPIAALQVNGNGLVWYPDSSGLVGTMDAPIPLTDTPGITHYFVSDKVNGCESKRATIEVQVINCCGTALVVPSAFSPNGDGHNDYFRILAGLDGIGVDYRIFNRWGQQVFHGLGNDKWDGKHHGEPAPAGTYFYEILVNCRNQPDRIRKGSFSLIR